MAISSIGVTMPGSAGGPISTLVPEAGYLPADLADTAFVSRYPLPGYSAGTMQWRNVAKLVAS
jgi:hypothetical protein